jgi:hypothetical protein
MSTSLFTFCSLVSASIRGKARYNARSEKIVRLYSVGVLAGHAD